MGSAPRGAASRVAATVAGLVVAGGFEVDGEVDADQLAAAVRVGAALVLTWRPGVRRSRWVAAAHSAGVPWRRSFIGDLLVAGWGLSPVAGGSAGAAPPVGLLGGGGGPVVEDLLHITLGDLEALAVEGAGQLAGGGPGSQGGQASELAGVEGGQVGLNLVALGRLPVGGHRRLAVLVELRRRPRGHLAVRGGAPSGTW